MHTFVISLPEDIARRASIETQLEQLGIEFEFFDAVRGSEKISDPRWYDDAAARKLEGRSLKPGEVGCALSHAAVYTEIAQRGLPWALILEDDAALAPDLPQVLSLLERKYLEQGDLVVLSRCDFYLPWTRKKVTDRYQMVTPIFIKEGSIAQTVGYIITQEAAVQIRNINIPVKFPADSWGYYRHHVRFKGIIPSLSLVTQHVELGSTITGNGQRTSFQRYSLQGILWNSFKTYNPLGRKLKYYAKQWQNRHGKSPTGI
ncbi:MAG TPA: glycosyltransferase family 25 protein [Rectinema sp.]|jgi:glycosyl transferase family 25|nr:MAG: Glycosyltransferase family 25 (LPS biosynthesis protein) [Spirochaetes bacterium ADurb.Bin110]HNV35514.1 glycosyltransferase family 25 protein [Rectinema sp.]HPW01314.1 glycosyltransferase family 25 protein [Rectinema sp.]HQN03063.1 glycosyltransferase family 25 protein [Rectinema sp.]